MGRTGRKAPAPVPYDTSGIEAENRTLRQALRDYEDSDNQCISDQRKQVAALRQAAMRLLAALANAQTEGGAVDPLACLRETRAAEDALEDLIPAEAWAAFHAARGGGHGA